MELGRFGSYELVRYIDSGGAAAAGPVLVRVDPRLPGQLVHHEGEGVFPGGEAVSLEGQDPASFTAVLAPSEPPAAYRTVARKTAV